MGLRVVCYALGAVLLSSLVGASEVKLTTLSTVFLPPRQVNLRGVNGAGLDPQEKLYYTASQDFINIIDLSDPENPELIDTLSYPNEGAQGLALAICGDNVFVAADTSPFEPPRRGVVYTFQKYDRQTGALPLVSTTDYGLFRYPRDLKLTRDCNTLVVALENFADFSSDEVMDAPGQLACVNDPASKYSKSINIVDYPGVFSFYQPDRIAYVKWRGDEFIITANEGQRQFVGPGGQRDAIAGADITDDMIADSVPPEFRAQLKNDSQLGRLLFSNVDGLNEEGKFEKFFMFGGRSFSIYRAYDFTLVFDSGSDFERAAEKFRPDVFNANIRFGGFTLQSQFDRFSRLSGAEPESIAVGKFGEDELLLIFIATERPGFIYVYSVARDIRKAKFQTLYFEGIPRDSNRTIEDLNETNEFKDLDPEIIEFFPPGVLADYGVLVICGGFSNTVTLVRVDIQLKEKEPYRPPKGRKPSVKAFFAPLAKWLHPTFCKLIGLKGCDIPFKSFDPDTEH